MTTGTSEQEYDYVVVGGGAGGCVVAARLAAESGGTVALVERGRADVSRWIHIPATFFKALISQDAEAVVSEADETLNGASVGVPQAKVLGGGSSINGMVYMRGQREDYDDWEREYGCEGWGYDEVLKTYKAQETNMRFDDDYHGQSGPLVVADPQSPQEVNAAAIEASVSYGIERNEDFNGEKQEGAGWHQVTAYKGQRQSAAYCFLRPVLGQENFTLLTKHTVSRVRIENRRATAVEATDAEGRQVVLKARREIVLSAGTFQTPKILMLSGVGPRDVLDRHGIDIIHEAGEVGRNYHDHMGTPVTRRLKRKIGVYGADKGLRAVRNGIDYWVFKRGLLTSNLVEAGACVDSNGSGRPDLQLVFSPFGSNKPGQPPHEFHSMQVLPMTMRPKSRSRLGLKSKNPTDQPLFQAKILDHPDDLDLLRRGVRITREIFDQPALREIAGEEIWPGKDISSMIGSNRLDDAIREQVRTIYHPAGTCRMGSTPAAVVDTKLRVNGIEGLRVADCSVLPQVTSGNTNAPTMMVGGRAADFILAGA